jgi:B12-binding domain/radical SAM domain protein
MKETCLIFYYHKLNRNSFRALAGALEIEKSLSKLPVFFPVNEKELKDTIKKSIPVYKKIIVGFSFATAQLPEIKLVIHQIKKQFPEIIAVAGGPHPSGDPKETLNLGFDIVIVGEGEKVFSDLVKKIASNSGSWRSQKVIIGTPVDLNKYPPFSERYNKIGPIEISRGCPWGCKYCQTSYIFGRKMRHRSISRIVKYTKISLKHNCKDIRFITPNSFAYGSKGGQPNLLALEKLLESARKAIKNKGRIFFGTFPSEVRPDFVTEETLNLVKRYCDNNNLIIGAQSGSPKILKEICRAHSVDDIYRAVQLTRKAGFIANVDFIFGLPGETKKDMFMTINLIEDLVKMSARIHGHYFMPLAGTPFEKRKAVPLPKKIKQILAKLEAAGKLYGFWRKQELISRVDL